MTLKSGDMPGRHEGGAKRDAFPPLVVDDKAGAWQGPDDRTCVRTPPAGRVSDRDLGPLGLLVLD